MEQYVEYYALMFDVSRKLKIQVYLCFEYTLNGRQYQKVLCIVLKQISLFFCSVFQNIMQNMILNLGQGCLWGASGTDGSYLYQSSIMYHQNSPVWCETICLSVPIEKYQTAHIRLEYRHCSSQYTLCLFSINSVHYLGSIYVSIMHNFINMFCKEGVKQFDIEKVSVMKFQIKVEYQQKIY